MTKKTSRGSSDDGSARLLVWPTSSLRASSGVRVEGSGNNDAAVVRDGLVVGWAYNGLANAAACRKERGIDTVVVAGILPYSSTTDDDAGIDVANHVESVRRRIRQLKKEYKKTEEENDGVGSDGCCCCCCTCDRYYNDPSGRRRHLGGVDGDTVDDDGKGSIDPISCAGCTREACILKELDVVGYLLRTDVDEARELSTVEMGKQLRLPIFSFRQVSLQQQKHEATVSGGGTAPDLLLPWWSNRGADGGPSRRRRQQLLLYDDVGRKGSHVLYRYAANITAVSSSYDDVDRGDVDREPSSRFGSGTLLTRLTHATAVVGLLLSSKNEEVDDYPIDHDSKTASHQNAEQLDHRFKGLLSFLGSYSLLFNHFARRHDLHPVQFALNCEAFPIERALALVSKSAHCIAGSPSSTSRSEGNCPVCSRRTVLHQTHFEAALERMKESDVSLRAAANAMFGLVFGIVLSFLWSCLSVQSEDSVVNQPTFYSRHLSTLRGGIDWLGRFPIGFKLNERLTETMGRDLKSFLRIYEWFISSLSLSGISVIRPLSFWYFFPAAGVLLGGSGSIALLLDLFRLSTLHTLILLTCFRFVYRAELYLLRALWRLFRGKKKNILRKRTDTMEYDSMQLLLGTILFAVALFLFTTIFVYHTFFAVTESCVALCSFPLLALYLLLERFPWGRLAERLRSNSFIDGVYLREVSGNPTLIDVDFDITYLEYYEKSYTSIIRSAFVDPASGLVRWALATFGGLLLGWQSQTTLIESVCREN